MTPLVRFRTDAKQFASCPTTNTKGRHICGDLLYLLRGPESNRGLEVLFFTYFHTCMDYPTFLIAIYAKSELFIIVSEPSESDYDLAWLPIAESQLF